MMEEARANEIQLKEDLVKQQVSMVVICNTDEFHSAE